MMLATTLFPVQPTIVLNLLKSPARLLEKKNKTYSRPCRDQDCLSCLLLLVESSAGVRIFKSEIGKYYRSQVRHMEITHSI